MACTTGEGAAAAATPADPSIGPARPTAPAKVKIHFQAVGSAKRMRKMKFKLDSTKRFAFIVSFLRKQLGLKPGQQLFCYVRSAFAPALDATVAELFQCFSLNDELFVNYSMTEAWG